MRKLLFLIPALSVALPTALLPQSEEEAILQVARDLFHAMKQQDTVQVRELFLPEARLYRLSIRDGNASLRPTTVEDFVQAIGTPGSDFLERMWNPEVRSDGPIATVWTPYDFHLNGEFSHCGVDAFQMARVGTNWKIVSIIYTVRREGCNSPLGPPQGPE